MSRVTIKDIDPGNVLDVADVGDTIDSWVSATTPTGNAAIEGGIDSDNIRDEGLDRRMFLRGDVVPDSGRGRVISGNSGSTTYTIVAQGSIHDGTWGLYNDLNLDHMVGPLTFSTADNHMLLVRYSLDVYAAPHISKSLGAAMGSGGRAAWWSKKTRISTRLVFIESGSTPTNASSWTSMPSTTRRLKMGAFGFHPPIESSQGGLGLPARIVNATAGTSYPAWDSGGSPADVDDNYTSAAGIFADKCLLRGNICASHLFESSSGLGTTGYTFGSTNSTTLYIGLQLRVDFWDDLTDAKIAINNAHIFARTFVR